MINFLYVLLLVAFLRVIFNFSKYFQCKRYCDKYYEWLQNPNWEIVENRTQIVKLFQDAGVKDSYRPTMEPLGFGQVQMANVSVLANFPSHREDFVDITFRMFHQAMGVYRSRALKTFNPIFWIEFIINFPRQVFVYLGVSPESIIIKIAQLIYWLLSVVIGFLWALHRTETEAIVKAWLDKLLP